MKILIESPFSLSVEQKRSIEERVSYLSTYNNKITQVSIYFKLDDGTMPNAVLAEIKLHVPGPEIFASETDGDYWSAFNGAYEKVKKQVRKKKEIRKDPYSQFRPI